MEEDFERITYDIPVESDSSLIQKLREDIQDSWMAPTRRDIEEISTSDLDGAVVKITMKDDSTPPTLGGYTHSLLNHGWGYVHYNDSELYVAPIEHDTDKETLYYRGRENTDEISRSILDSDIEIKYNDQVQETDVRHIKDIIVSNWELEDTKSVTSISPATGHKTYMIEIDTKNKDSKPTVPTKNAFDSLIRNGWGISGIKTRIIFVSQITPVVSDKNKYVFKGDSYDYYSPSSCEVCGEREFVKHYVVGTRESKVVDERHPIRKKYCNKCAENDADSIAENMETWIEKNES